MSYSQLLTAIIETGKKCIVTQVIFILFKVLVNAPVSWFLVFFPMWGPALIMVLAYLLISLWNYLMVNYYKG